MNFHIADTFTDSFSRLTSDEQKAVNTCACDKPKSGRIAVMVINHLGDEVMKVFKVSSGQD
ncbi:MAG: hypothetical protein NTY98_05575 [Verrucomicrobia bacterium]|nr:hypothetical protein [Verrucomicrobiota bacterium]